MDDHTVLEQTTEPSSIEDIKNIDNLKILAGNGLGQRRKRTLGLSASRPFPEQKNVGLINFENFGGIPDFGFLKRGWPLGFGAKRRAAIFDRRYKKDVVENEKLVGKGLGRVVPTVEQENVGDFEVQSLFLGKTIGFSDFQILNRFRSLASEGFASISNFGSISKPGDHSVLEPKRRRAIFGRRDKS